MNRTRFVKRKSNSCGMLKILQLVLAAAYVTSTGFADDVFVDIDAPNGGDGDSWLSPYRYLDDALADNSLASGDIIHLGEGTYFPGQDSGFSSGNPDRESTFTIPHGVIVLGGHAGYGAPTPGDWDPKLYPVVLDGNVGDPMINTDNVYHVVTLQMSNGDETFINGVTIQNGRASGDGTPGDCTCHDGGGLFCDGIVDMRILNCRFLNNYALDRGAAIATGESIPGFQTEDWYISNCEFVGNHAVERGGAIHVSEDVVAPPSLVQFEVYNSTFIDNTSERAGAISIGENINAKVVNCSFSRNHMTGNDSGGAAIRFHPQMNGKTLEIYNSIFWNNKNTAGQLPLENQIWVKGTQLFSYTVLIDNSLVQELSTLDFVWSGINNLVSDPMFVLACNGDLRPSDNSPVIDNGLNAYMTNDVFDVDRDGDSSELTPDVSRLDRVIAASIDIGAHEGAAGLQLCPADLDESCDVGISDLLILLANWGTAGPGATLAVDLTIVDAQDLLVLLSSWGDCVTGEGEVPETVSECIEKYGAGTPEAEACIQALQWSGSS